LKTVLPLKKSAEGLKRKDFFLIQKKKKKEKRKEHIKYSLSDTAITHAEMALFQMFKHCSAWSKT